MSGDIPAWVGQFVGLHYADKGRGPDAFDCWGLVREVLRIEEGIVLPDYTDVYYAADDQKSVSAAIIEGLKHGWKEVTKPRDMDLLTLRIAGRPWHCAIMVTSDKFLHVPPPRKDGLQILSCIERLDSPIWAKRLEGFFRYEH